MANWVKLLLGVLVSAGIFVGVWAWVYDTHPLRDDSIYAQRQRCEEQNRYRLQTDPYIDCFERFRSREEATETSEKWLGAGLGVVGAGLFWLLVWLFYIKPRRRRTAAEGTDV